MEGIPKWSPWNWQIHWMSSSYLKPTINSNFHGNPMKSHSIRNIPWIPLTHFDPKFQGFNRPQKPFLQPSGPSVGLRSRWLGGDLAIHPGGAFFCHEKFGCFSLEEVTWWWLYGDLMNISWCFKWGFIVTWWDCIVIFHGVGQGVKLPQVELEVSKHIYCLGLPWFTTILINDKGCIAHVYSRACFCGPFLVHQKNWLIQMASF